jgi:hypothetical protein
MLDFPTELNGKCIQRTEIFLFKFPPSRPNQIRAVFVDQTSCVSHESLSNLPILNEKKTPCLLHFLK